MRTVIYIFLISLLTHRLWSQDECEKSITLGYIPLEQNYKMPLKDNTTFNVTFYDNYIYRVAFCSKHKDSFYWTLYDMNDNVLFSNKYYNNAIYWDFTFQNTIECKVVIETKDKSPPLNSHINLFIGYKHL